MNLVAERRLNVVVVDDDPSITRLVTQIIQKAKEDTANIVSFEEPRKAIAWIDEHCCDILFSDIEMPDIDGLEMLRIAKGRNAWTQVIFMTAHSTWDRIAEAIELGASDYLIKPIDKKELLEVLEHECSRVTRWRVALSGTLSAAGE